MVLLSIYLRAAVAVDAGEGDFEAILRSGHLTPKEQILSKVQCPKGFNSLSLKSPLKRQPLKVSALRDFTLSLS